MTLYEAFAELGIDQGAGADQARRAYLKLLKVRKPEADPQGFMRLREAYELVKGRLDARELFEAMRAGAGPSPEALRDPRPYPTPEPPAAAAEEPPAAEPAFAEPAAEAPEPAEPSFSEPRADPLPDDDRLFPEPPADEPRANEEPVAADEREDAEPGFTGHEEPPDAARVDALLAAGLDIVAAYEMVRLLDASARRLDGPTPPVATALHLLALMHSQNEIDHAAELHLSFKEWLAASGQESRVLRGELAARWSLLREMRTLHRSFPPAVRAAIGRGVLAGDLGQAQRELRGLKDRRAARDAAATLRGQTPLLAAALADVLDPPFVPPRSAPAPARSSGKGGWVIAAAVIGMLRVVLMLGRPSVTPSYSPSFSQPRFNLPTLPYLDGGLYLPDLDAGTWRLGDDRRADLKGRVLFHLNAAQAHVWYEQGRDAGRRSLDYAKVGSDIDDLGGALGTDDCKAAKASMKKLQSRVLLGDLKGEDAVLKNQIDSLSRALTVFCGELAKREALDAGAAGANARRDAGSRGVTTRP